MSIGKPAAAVALAAIAAFGCDRNPGGRNLDPADNESSNSGSSNDEVLACTCADKIDAIVNGSGEIVATREDGASITIPAGEAVEEIRVRNLIELGCEGSNSAELTSDQPFSVTPVLPLNCEGEMPDIELSVGPNYVDESGTITVDVGDLTIGRNIDQLQSDDAGADVEDEVVNGTVQGGGGCETVPGNGAPLTSTEFAALLAGLAVVSRTARRRVAEAKAN